VFWGKLEGVRVRERAGVRVRESKRDARASCNNNNNVKSNKKKKKK